MKIASEYGCVLRINTGEQNPDIISKMTGIENTELQMKGKP